MGIKKTIDICTIVVKLIVEWAIEWLWYKHM